MDLHHAYRILPVHADDHPLLAIKWEQSTYMYINTALPFGLQSAPKIFSAFADGLAWILHSRGVSRQLHFLDDFSLLVIPASHECALNLQTALDVCQQLGVLVAMHKCEGPSTKLTFLGIQIDSEAMQLSLAEDKLSHTLALVLAWRSKKAATKHDLQSLIGHLSHAATVVQHGRTFLRRMIDTMKTAKWPHHHVRLLAEFRSDLLWWATFLPKWNGKSMLRQPEPAFTVTSDASGAWGCGAVNCSGDWFQLQWPECWLQFHIAAKEMVPVVISVAIWGNQWCSSNVLVQSDNMAVVSAISSGSAKDTSLMHLLRCLHFFLAHFDITLTAKHLPGIQNTAADALSRDNLHIFF